MPTVCKKYLRGKVHQVHCTSYTCRTISTALVTTLIDCNLQTDVSTNALRSRSRVIGAQRMLLLHRGIHLQCKCASAVPVPHQQHRTPALALLNNHDEYTVGDDLDGECKRLVGFASRNSITLRYPLKRSSAASLAHTTPLETQRLLAHSSSARAMGQT